MSREKQYCMECGVIEGEFHKDFCCSETCPRCGEFLYFNCQCFNTEIDEALGQTGAESIDDRTNKAAEARKLVFLIFKGDNCIPFVYLPVLCGLCGQKILKNSSNVNGRSIFLR